MMKGMVKFAVLAVSSLGLAACNGGSDSAAVTTGNVTFALTDASVDGVTAVNITVTGLELKPASGATQTITFDQPMHLNLLDLRDGKTANLILQKPLPAGDYNWVRLDLDTSQQTVQTSVGGTQSLTIPSGAETGLKLVRGFTVPSGGNINFVLDFNVRKSLVEASGNYMLKPTLRIVDESTAGAITGTVDVGTLESTLGCSGMPTGYNGVVYLYSGDNATIGDYGGGNEPYLATAVTYNSTSSQYDYTLAHLPPGDYTLAYTCDVDDNTTAESLNYDNKGNVVVQANQTTTVNLP